MISLIKKLLWNRTTRPQSSDFSAFFRDASETEQKKVLMGVIKKANQEQRKVIERYNEITKTT